MYCTCFFVCFLVQRSNGQTSPTFDRQRQKEDEQTARGSFLTHIDEKINGWNDEIV